MIVTCITCKRCSPAVLKGVLEIENQKLCCTRTRMASSPEVDPSPRAPSADELSDSPSEAETACATQSQRSTHCTECALLSPYLTCEEADRFRNALSLKLGCEVEGVLGVGGISVCFEAKLKTSGNAVAIKVSFRATDNDETISRMARVRNQNMHFHARASELLHRFHLC